MNNAVIQAFYGEGRGKTSAAIGQALRDLGVDEHLTMIQFLKGKDGDEFGILQRLEPYIKIFRFDKSEKNFEHLPEFKKEEEKQNIINGVNYARKVIETGESEVIILDEILGVMDFGIISEEDVMNLLKIAGTYKKLIITGTILPDNIREYGSRNNEFFVCTCNL